MFRADSDYWGSIFDLDAIDDVGDVNSDEVCGLEYFAKLGATQANVSVSTGFLG